MWPHCPSAAGAGSIDDVDALHRAAIAAGPLPERVEVEQVAEFSFPQTLAIAGDGWKAQPMEWSQARAR